MRKLAAAALVAIAVSCAPAADAARPPLDYSRALNNAQREARKMASTDGRITDWEIVRGFRFTSTKWVFVWWAQLGDGRICSAQLVARYRNSKQTKVISYFRNEDCG